MSFSVDGSIGSLTKFAPDQLRAIFTNGLGYASPNRFEVELPKIDRMRKPDGSSVSDTTESIDRVMLCTAAGIPGKTIDTVDRQFGGENYKIAVGHSMQDVALTFYLDNTYMMKNYFQEWQECVVNQGAKDAIYAGYYTNYVQDVTIRQYTKNGRRVYAVKLIDAYPTAVNTIELNNQLQTAVGEVTVNLTYRTYEPEQEKEGLLDLIG